MDDVTPFMKQENECLMDVDGSEGTPRAPNEVPIVLPKDYEALLLKLSNVTIASEPPNFLNEVTLFNEIIAGMDSGYTILQICAIQVCSKLLKCAEYPPIDTMISKGIIPRCIAFLSSHHNSALQLEASSLLANLTSGTSELTMIVVNNGAIPKLIKLLKSSVIEVVEQAVWALGNIAGDNPDARKQVKRYKCLSLFLNFMKTDAPVSLIRNIVRTSANLCENEKFQRRRLNIILLILNRSLTGHDPETHAQACRALVYLTSRGKSRIQPVLDSGVVPKMMPLLASPNIVILFSTIGVLGNIASGNKKQTDYIINAGVLGSLKKLLKHKEPQIVEIAAWALSNITAGVSKQIQHVIDAGILPSLFKVLNKGDVKAREEAAWAVTNLVLNGSLSQNRQFIHQSLLTPLTPVAGRLVANLIGDPR